MTRAHLVAGLLLALVGLAPLRARAFSVPDHRALTQAALEAALESGARPLLAAHRAEVLHGATAEDLNLHVKWAGWHHFYSPEAPLDTPLRQGSEARVRQLWAEALEAAHHGDMGRAFDRAGHLAHHLQDMASPPHVVPVNHGPFDGFEQYGVRDALSRAARRDVAPLSGVEAQRALARETLVEVRTGTLLAGEARIPWSAFWSEPATRGPGAFGRYGDEAGNIFGQPVVRWRGLTHPVPAQAYASFMETRVAAAEAYTRAFLEWAAERFEEAAAEKSSSALRPFEPSPTLSLELLGGIVRDTRGALPTVGLRASLPLHRGLALSVEGTRSAAGLGPVPTPDSWALALLSPPLWTARPGYAVGLDVRASAGVGRFAWAGQGRWGLPLGLRARASLSAPLTLSAELRYQGVSPPEGGWAHGLGVHVGLGVTLGDR